MKTLINPEYLSHKEYTFLEIELARQINLLWENRKHITQNDLETLEYLSNKSYSDQSYKK